MSLHIYAKLRWGVLATSLIVIAFYLSSISLLAQSGSPENVVLSFRAMDARGERLTDSGWDMGAKFFVKPMRRPPRLALGVIAGEVFEYTRVNGLSAEVHIRQTLLGQIDSSGRFTSLVAPQLIPNPGSQDWEPGVPKLHGPFLASHVFQVVFGDSHWDFLSKQGELREVKEPSEWRLTHFAAEPWVTKDVAIRYLKSRRESASTQEQVRVLDDSLYRLTRLK